jgi:membrane fusion protein, copper/silver efflux system
MTPHVSRRFWFAATAVVIIGAGVWVVVALTHRGSAPTGTSATQPMANMPATSNGAVTLTADQIRQFGITFGTAEVRQLTVETRTTGVVTFDETRVVQVAARIAGFVERLYVNATGQPVSRGQRLMEIYSPELVAAQQELLVAGQLGHDMGRSAVPGVPGSTTDLVAASRRRLQLWDISESQIDEIIRTGKVRRTLTLFAPASGVVVEKKVLQGQAVTAGEALYTIADLGNVWIDVQLREADAAAVRAGSGADIEITGLAGRALKGRVAYVYPTLDSASRAVRARVAVANAGGVLKPGMYATVRLSTPSRSALTVPSSALLRTGERNVVFIEAKSGALMPFDVQVGRTAGEYTEILAGLDAGQRVVTSAQFLLDSESNLGDVMRSMISQGGGSRTGSADSMKDMPGMPVPAVAAPRR